MPRKAAGNCESPATLSVTAMLTTDGTTRLTKGAKDGSAVAPPIWALEVMQPHSVIRTARARGLRMHE